MKVKIYTNNPSQDIVNKILNLNRDFILSENNFELLIVIGGDGTFLQALKQYKDLDIKIILFNTGKIGFFSYKENDIVNILNENNFINYSILELNNNEDKYFAINDFLLNSINNPFSYELDFNNTNIFTLRASGFLLSTKNGSTGLNRSLNGPILIDDNSFIFQEFLPVKSSKDIYVNQPIVLNDSVSLKIKNLSLINNIWLKIDGKSAKFNFNEITIKLVKSKAKILKINSTEWIKNIKTKLMEKN